SYSDDEIRALISQLGGLISNASDDRAIVLGRLAEAFLPGAMSDPDPDAIAAAMTSAAEALTLAERLDDQDLQSAALDGSTIGPLTDDRPEAGLVFIRRRLALRELVTSERLDGQIMLAWMEMLRGDLAASETAAAAVREGLTAGQAPVWVMGASGWRTDALWALGRWDDALAEAARSELAWRESQVHAPTFALNGFLAAFSIARARRDPVDAERWRSLAETLIQRGGPGNRAHRMTAFLGDDLEALARNVVAEHRTFYGRLDYVHRSLARLVDLRYSIDESVLTELLAYAAERKLRFVEANVRRGLGVLYGQTSQLREALVAFESMAAQPFVARTRAELGRLERDGALLETGLRELEQIGDLEQLERAVAESR
ncbi:MAG TPA: hypothetical protein VIL50_09085, partial [Candidatus Limnocylindrales bacterium]